MLRYFQQFVHEDWAKSEKRLLTLVPKLSSNGLLKRIPYSSDIEELPGNSTWVDSILLSLERKKDELQSILDAGSETHSFSVVNEPEISQFSKIWHQLQILPSLVSPNQNCGEVAIVFEGLMQTLLQFRIAADPNDPLKSYSVLYGKLLSVSVGLGLKPNEKEVWRFLQSALPVAAKFTPVVRGTRDFLGSCERCI